MKKAIAQAAHLLRSAGYRVQVRIRAETRTYGAYVQTPHTATPRWWSSQRLLRRASQMRARRRANQINVIAVGLSGQRRNDRERRTK